MMNEKTKVATRIIFAAVPIGILGNALLRHTPWGLNAFVFVTVFLAVLLLLIRAWRPELLTKTNLALAAAMEFFAAMFLIRTSEELLAFDTIAIVVIMGVLLLSNVRVKAEVAGVFHYALGIVGAGLTSAIGSFGLLGADVDWRSIPANNTSRHFFSVLRGVAIALPLLLIFGALFMAADAAYEGAVNRALNFDINNIVNHFVISAVLAWLTAGYFRGVLARNFLASADATPEAAKGQGSQNASVVDQVTEEEPEEMAGLPNNATILEHINISDPPDEPATAPTPSEEAKKSDGGESSPGAGPYFWSRNWPNFDSSKLPSVFTFGTVETVIILGLLDLLFLSFVIFQLPYFFGGIDLVRATPDFTLADYARRGFGELVAVGALVLPILLLSHWLLRKDGGKAEPVFKLLAGVQIALLFVIMASAAQRLLLLTGKLGYGLTTTRFYPMVLMIWLAVVFVWFAFTIFRGARQRFAWGALWAAIAILGATNLANPDALIATTNLELMRQGRKFDARYNSRQSDDAIPAIIEGLPGMSFENQCIVRRNLNRRYEEQIRNQDLRSISFSRVRAFSYLSAGDGFVVPAACPSAIPPPAPTD